jgi:hypothetical protein
VHCSHTSWFLLMCSHYHVHTTVMYWLCKESGSLVAMAHNFSMESNSGSCLSVKTTWQYSFCSHWKIFISVNQKLFHVICANSSDPSFGGDMADVLHGPGYSVLKPQNTFVISGHNGHWTTSFKPELFIPALLDVMDGLLYLVLLSPVPHMVFPISRLDGLPKRLEDFCWWPYVWAVRK